MKTTFFSKIVKSVAVVALICGVGAFAKQTCDGEYIKLDRPIANVENTVVKVFSYDCPFCYKYDKGVTKPVMQKVGDLKFTPFHLATKGVFGNYGSELLATMMVLDDKNGVSYLDDASKFKKAKFALYNAYHDKKERWGAKTRDEVTPEKVANFIKTGLDAAGVSLADYEVAKADPKVAELLNAWGMDNTGAAYSVAEIQGVPAYVVDGKYLICTKNIKGIDQMAELIKTIHGLK